MEGYFMKKIIAFLVLMCFGQIQAYRYTFNNKSDTTIKASLNLMTGGYCNESVINGFAVDSSVYSKLSTKPYKETFIAPDTTGVIDPGEFVFMSLLGVLPHVPLEGCSLWSAKVEFLNGKAPDKIYKPKGGRLGNINFTVTGANGHYDLQVH
jgi:hypothetical protein